jgi:cytochrome P450
MRYLRYALLETLRLYPAVPYNVRTALTDTTLPGAPGLPDIPVLKGDIVSYSPYLMQRRRDLYPPTSDEFADPLLFSPERWFNWQPRAWEFIPFNGGPRIVRTPQPPKIYAEPTGSGCIIRHGPARPSQMHRQ